MGPTDRFFGGIAVADAGRVGVAALREASPDAFRLRADWCVPACGHALVARDRVLIHLEHVGLTFPEPLYGWVTTGETAIGVGRLLPAGAGWVLEGDLPVAPDGLAGIWVTAGEVVPQDPAPLLEGALIWLELAGSGQGQAEPDEEPEPCVVALSVAEPAAVEQEPEPEQVEVEPEPELAAEAGAGAEPPAAARPRVVTLSSAHPGAPRAAGNAALDLAHGGLTLIARGLPAPAALGQDPATGRPYDAYRVWLVGAGGRQRLPAGLCSRVWGDHFRCQIDFGLPLAACDTVVVAPADRANQQPALGTVRVLEGSIHDR